MAELREYLALGQSIWLDDIRREYFSSGELFDLVRHGVRGLTSNPSIFEKAITGSAAYDMDIDRLVQLGKTTQEIYETLVIEDIREAADALRSVYDESQAMDGFVSLEVDPALAHDTDGTIEAALSLFRTVDRPNLMIKIPATPEGLPAIRTALAQGVNVNVTLIFSVSQYQAVVQAHLAGLEDRLEKGGVIDRIASVASFFVSRLDTVVDKQLETLGKQELLGRAAIANSKIAYSCFQDLYAGSRWDRLASKGAQKQRPLWASTSTKNPAYPDTYYLDGLVGPDTVNTLPYATLQAAMDHGVAERTLDRDLGEARANLAQLADFGIDLEQITQKLQDDGVTAFAASFNSLMGNLANKIGQARAGDPVFSASLGSYQAKVEAALSALAKDRVIPRIWESDFKVWKPDPKEISNRLGWLRITESVQAELPAIDSFVNQVRHAGYDRALLLGMGGSSLAPEVFRKTFGVRPGYLDLAVLDSTDPSAVLDYAQRFDPQKTLYIVSTKSGGTVETLSFFKYFYNQSQQAVGPDGAGDHFIAITDPGSPMVDIARQYNFREVFLNDPNIGGRYSALSHFGLVPAALVGVDLRSLLKRAGRMSDECTETDPTQNHAARLGVIMGALACQGRDKLTLITSASICYFVDWVEQLIAESTGKDGQGILPVVGEVVGDPEVYGDDRFFVYLTLANDHDLDAPVQALDSAGYPVLRIELQDLFDLGGQFFMWEFATSIAGQILEIHPFNQPNVEAAKVQAHKMVEAYQENGRLPELNPTLREGGITLYGDVQAESIPAALKQFLARAQPGAYIAVQAYIPPSSASDASLLALRTELRTETKLAVTTGYGPRFLHSTGQLHKGDAGKGLFIQITADALEDALIPDEAGKKESGISFGVLEQAQALGDRQALLDNNRQLIRFHIEDDIQIGITRLIRMLKG
jgi:transaldolase/glucose-6-phosphate isomerase